LIKKKFDIRLIKKQDTNHMIQLLLNERHHT